MNAGGGAPDKTALESLSDDLHRKMLTRKLAEMRPTAPRTKEAFAALMRELSGIGEKDD